MANYNDLRAQTLGSTQEEEAVTVNTRALIDKVLARYSSENTTLRELIQNAADAGATSVEVRYDTIPGTAPEPVRMPESQSDVLQRVVKSKVARLLVKNNGQAFREEDWQRLKRIAEGNPDETKIGAFGVGFYSVFADTDEPFISSGNQTMAFYWKGNSLFTRRATMKNTDAYTTFLLDYREPGDLPDLKVLCQFFATSLTFVKLNEISLYIDDRQMLLLKKKESPPMGLEIPRSIVRTTKDQLMTIAGVETSRVQLDAKYLNVTHYRPVVEPTGSFARFFSKIAAPQVTTKDKITSSNLHEHTTASIFLRIATATITTKVSTKFSAELERATKKPPPKTTFLACLTMSKDEQDASEHESVIFENVIPSKAGKIFIGFPTHQTTSFKAHISAHSVIPTVERENIDLNARIIKNWNIEMLRTAGILGRIMYVDEMTTLGRRAAGLKPSDLEALYPDAMHIMQQFTFGLSTPSSAVGEHIAEAFWSCTKYTDIELLSTKGVLPSTKVRLAGDIDFLDGLPMLPPKLVAGAPDFVQILKQGGYVGEITITDIKHELSDKPLSAKKAVQFLKWLAKEVGSGEMDEFQAKMLLDNVIVLPPKPSEKSEKPSGPEDMPFALMAVKSYASTEGITTPRFGEDLPLPPTCLPHFISRKLTGPELQSLTWTELGIPEWLAFVINSREKLPVQQCLTKAPPFANQVLALISKDWDKLIPSVKTYVLDCLKDLPCIPTKQGMKIPRESYLPVVKLFSDLPIIHGLQGVKERFLVALGVRKTVELELVFRRLTDGVDGEKWSHVDLLKYLISVREDIPSEDMKKLRNAALWKAEPRTSITMYRANQLYAPSAAHRTLQLPVFWWPGEWRETGPEYQFLNKLGLQMYPSADTLMKLAASKDQKIRASALGYIVRHFVENGYDSKQIAKTNIAFLPIEKSDRLVRPSQCFSGPAAALFGFNLLHKSVREYAAQFGVRSDPPMEDCCEQIIKNPPASWRDGRAVFEYLGTRLKDIYSPLANKVGTSFLVPTLREKEVHHLTPRLCYIGEQNHEYAKIFDFVDFGPAANSFLMHCGSKPEPSPRELAYRLAAEPAKLYRLFQSEEKYLALLKKIALEWSSLKKDDNLVHALKQSSCLGAYKEIVGVDSGNKDEDNVKEFLLARAQDIYIQDDITAYRVFKGQIAVAPEDEALESLYKNLGALSLISNIKEKYIFGSRADVPEITGPLKKLIVERSRLFLHNSSDAMKHDANWIEKNVEVAMTKSIKLTRILSMTTGAISRGETKTAALVKTPGSEHLSLFCTQQYQTYDIANGLVKVLLYRPKPHSTLLLDSLMSTDLQTLQTRGFNVGRILRAKAAEAKLMEAERLKKFEAQQAAIEAQERAHQEAHQAQVAQRKLEAESQRTLEQNGRMPGGFDDDSQPRAPQSEQQPNDWFSRGFSKFTKLLNEDKGRQPQDQQQQQPLLEDQNQKAIQQPTSQPQQSEKPNETHIQEAMEKPTSPHRLAANLQRAVNSSRRHDDTKLFTQPQTFDVKESSSFCDTRPGQNLLFAATSSTGIKIYLESHISDSDRSQFFSLYSGQLTAFGQLLKEITTVFSMELSTMHIFYDHTGSTIAFNLNGSVFCNVRFFLQLHANREGLGERGWDAEAVRYWFVTVCHELAHNLVKDHSANHSFYTESFVVQYMEKSMELVMKARGGGA